MIGHQSVRKEIGRLMGLALCFLTVGSFRAFAAPGVPSAAPPDGWIDGLPSVDAVLRAIPPGTDPKETWVRHVAALNVLEDLIKVFTGKNEGSLSEMPQGAGARFREYHDAASKLAKGPLGPAWNLAFTKEFREEVLAKTVSAESQRAYWRVRTVTMAQAEARTSEGLRIANTSVDLMALLPPVEQVERDMMSTTPRDSAARSATALHWLAIICENLPGPGGRSKGSQYGEAYDRLLETHSDSCKDEPGCQTSDTGSSRFYKCRSGYESSPEFLRALVDRYIPADRQPILRNLINSPALLQKALAFPPGTAFAIASTAEPPTLACVVERHAADMHRQLAMKADERRRVKAAAVQKQRRLALSDGERASARVDTKVFGVPLGTPLPLPNCESVGQWTSPLQADDPSRDFTDDHMESAKTCLLTKNDGSTEIVWGHGALPEWAQSVDVGLLDDIVTSILIAFPRPAEPAVDNTYIDHANPGWPDGRRVIDTSYPTRKHEADAVANGRVAPRAAHEQKGLEKKYGRATCARTKFHLTMGGDQVLCRDVEWSLAGMLVQYRACPYDDSLWIGLQSAFNGKTSQRCDSPPEVP